MPLTIFNEDVLRDYGDEPTRRMLDLWHGKCLARLNNDVEVIMADRRENPQLRDDQGEINSAAPAVIEGKLRLVLWFDSVYPLNPLLVTHEVGHWVLALQGHRTRVDPHRTYGDVVINLNSLAQHPPLFRLQRCLGHEPQDMIDLKANNDMDYLKSQKDGDPRYQVSNALLVADDLLNCSESYQLRLRNTLRKRFPDTGRLVRAIISDVSTADLDSPEKNFRLLHKLAKTLKLENWIELDPIPPMIAHFETPQ